MSAPRRKVEHFPHALVGEFISHSGREFMLTRAFIYLDSEITITVPDGFVTDFSSVPRGLWNVFPPWEYPEAGVIHDFLYRFPRVGATRSEADRVYRRILDICGCHFVKRQAMWLALRTFGGHAWRGK